METDYNHNDSVITFCHNTPWIYITEAQAKHPGCEKHRGWRKSRAALWMRVATVWRLTVGRGPGRVFLYLESLLWGQTDFDLQVLNLSQFLLQLPRLPHLEKSLKRRPGPKPSCARRPTSQTEFDFNVRVANITVQYTMWTAFGRYLNGSSGYTGLCSVE